MLADGRHTDTIQLRHQSLCQPYIFILVAQFDTPRLIANGADKSKILRSRTADGYFVFKKSCNEVSVK